MEAIALSADALPREIRQQLEEAGEDGYEDDWGEIQVGWSGMDGRRGQPRKAAELKREFKTM